MLSCMFCCGSGNDIDDIEIIMLSRKPTFFVDDYPGSSPNPGNATSCNPIEFDLTFTPRTLGKILSESQVVQHYTPRELKLFKHLTIPEIYDDAPLPIPPGLKVEDEKLLTREDRHKLLSSMFRDFVMEMNRGVYLTQIAATREYCQIHCSLDDNLTNLTLDQNTGRLVEFPTNGMHRVFLKEIDAPRAQLNCGTNSERPPAIVPKLDLNKLGESRDFIVVVEFSKRKLIFVFEDYVQADRFKMCMQMLANKVNPKSFCNRDLTVTPPSTARILDLPLTPTNAIIQKQESEVSVKDISNNYSSENEYCSLEFDSDNVQEYDKGELSVDDNMANLNNMTVKHRHGDNTAQYSYTFTDDFTNDITTRNNTRRCDERVRNKENKASYYCNRCCRSTAPVDNYNSNYVFTRPTSGGVPSHYITDYYENVTTQNRNISSVYGTPFCDKDIVEAAETCGIDWSPFTDPSLFGPSKPCMDSKKIISCTGDEDTDDTDLIS